MTLPDWQAISTAGSWLWYLSAYKKYLYSLFHCDCSFSGSANNGSFKGCTHLRAPSWAVTCRLGEVCTHFTLCSWPAHSINGKKNNNNKTANNKNRKLHVRGKYKGQKLSESVAKYILKNVKFYVLHLNLLFERWTVFPHMLPRMLKQF